MKYYCVQKAKEHLTNLLKQVALGEEIVIIDKNRPVAKRVAIQGIDVLPRVNIQSFLRKPPIPLLKGGVSSSKLIRRLRDEE